jgi:endogenous inhibitor of DNA gyrase (YacG/DUF329 family)
LYDQHNNNNNNTIKIKNNKNNNLQVDEATSSKMSEKALRIHCAVCGKAAAQEEKLRVCSGCKVVPYCSKQCQMDDWKLHKQACQAMKRKQ